jgi:sialidase-1
LGEIYHECEGGGDDNRTGEAAYFGFRIPGVVYDQKHDVLMTFAQGMYTTCGFMDKHDKTAEGRSQLQSRLVLSADPGQAAGAEVDPVSNDTTAEVAAQPLGDLVLKRSLDGGKTFLPLQVVFNSSSYGQGGVWDPTPVYEQASGTVFVFFAISPAGEPIGTTKRRKWAYSASTDGGLSWKYTDVSQQCNPTNHADTAFCGGHGTQLSNGRLVVPIYNNPGFTTCYSTDKGITWSSKGAVPYKSPTPDYNPAEAEIVELFSDAATGDVGSASRSARELAPPRLLVNFRYDGPMSGAESCGTGVKHCRWFAYSDDYGLSWSNGTAVGAIPDSECKGGIARWAQGKSLVAVNVGSDSARVNCTVYLSEDNGQTWPKKLQVNPLCGYTTVALMRRGTPMVDTIVNMYDTEATCSINVALVDPTKM